MKAKKRVKGDQTNERIMIACRNVEVDRKKDIVLIRSDIGKMTEDEISDLLIRISNENKEFHKTYYAQNTPVMQIKRRTFSDLLKDFIGKVKERTDFRMAETTAQYKGN